jgi:hypothetical protein
VGTGPLYYTQQATASATTVEVVFGTNGLGGSNDIWNVQSTAVAVTGSVLTPIAKVFRGLSTFNNYIDGTSRGDGDTSNTYYTVNPGEIITVQWTNVSVGAVVHVTIMGQRFFEGDAFSAVY